MARAPRWARRMLLRTRGRRAVARACRRDVARILELHGRGFSSETISKTVSLSGGFVDFVLRSHAAGEGEGEGART